MSLCNISVLLSFFTQLLHKYSFSTICKQSRSKRSTALIVGFILSWQHEAYVREYLSVGMVTLRIGLRVKKYKEYRYKGMFAPNFSVIPAVLSFFFIISSFLKSILFLFPRYFHLPSSYLNPLPHSLIPLFSVSLDYSNLSLPLEVLQFPYTDSFTKLFLHSFQSVSFHLLLFLSQSSAVCFEIIDGVSYGNNFKLVCWKD